MLPRAPRLLWRLLMISLALGLVVHAARGQNFEEYHIKAALLAKIPLFVEWPKEGVPRDDKTFVIGILGPSPFGQHLKALEMQSVKNKKIVAKSFATMKDYEPCHMLFISGKKDAGSDGEQRLARALDKLKSQPVLIIADTAGLGEKGAAMNLYLDGENVKIEMNREAAQRAGLTTSAQLLKIIEKNGRFVSDAK